VSRLTFNIDPQADFVGGKRVSPWAALRANLFGIETAQPAWSVPAFAEDEPSWQMAVRRLSALQAAQYSEPFAVIPPLLPAQIAVAAIVPMPASDGAQYQAEYKGRMISASRLEDGSWTAVHRPTGADPLALCDAQKTDCFPARVLAIASAEIEIDELEHAAS